MNRFAPWIAACVLAAMAAGGSALIRAQSRQPQPGDPLPGITAHEFELFHVGLEDFLEVEAAGVNIFPGFAGVETIEENGVVAGVRTGDKGIDKNGERKANFEPGIDLRAKVTAFGDGPRGYLSKQLIARHGLLQGRSPQVFETGVKEVFEVPRGRTDVGRVVHTMGYPFRRDNVGGTFLYTMANNLLALGVVTPLTNVFEGSDKEVSAPKVDIAVQ